MDEDDDGGGGGGAPAWMATFADMSTLLLTFFVLLLSFATMDVQNFRMALGSVKEALGVISRRPGYFEGISTTPVPFEHEQGALHGADREETSMSDVESLIQKFDLRKKIKIVKSKKKVTLRINDLFAPGSAKLTPYAFEALDVAARVCRQYSLPIKVEAHTDSRPLGKGSFPSNWELSSMRAGVVARYLIKAGKVEAQRVEAAGRAFTRPVATNDTPEGRAENRRVDIVMLKELRDEAEVTNSQVWSQGE